MRLKRCILAFFVGLFLNAAVSGSAQVRPSATEGGWPLTVGAGFSNYSADWAYSRIDGSALWVDWYPSFFPTLHLRGLGVEAEARDLSWGRPSTLPPNFRQDTAGGGLIYSWQRFRNIHPYLKGLAEFGSFDFEIGSPTYTHDTRTVGALGGGLDYRVYKHVWVRGDYEYQTWGPMFNGGHPTPNGFTIGVLYDFRPVQ